MPRPSPPSVGAEAPRAAEPTAPADRNVAGGARRFGAHRGRRGVGAYCGGRPPTARWLLRSMAILVVLISLNELTLKYNHYMLRHK